MTGGARSTGEHVRTLLGDRLFLGAMLASALTAAAYFAYLAGASFVLQDIYALSPAAYSLVFGLNAAGFALFGFLGGRAAERWSERLAFVLGLGIIAVGACGLLVTALLQLPLPFAIVSFFAVAAGAAAVSPPATSLALADYPQFAGTASSILGVTRFAAGALAAPLVGIAGSMTMVPLGIVTVVSTALAAAAYAWLVRRPTSDPSAASDALPSLNLVSDDGGVRVPRPAVFRAPQPDQHGQRSNSHACSCHVRPRRCPGREPSRAP